MDPLGNLGLSIVISLFVLAAIVIAVVGTRMAAVADRLADKTGMGEAVMGALFLGGATSLSGLVTSITAAAREMPELALSNALGGIAAQTVFLAVADFVHRRANLEHAGATPEALMQGSLLVTLLALPIVAFAAPSATLLSIHPVSFAMVLGYVLGMRLISRVSEQPMWTVRHTAETRADVPDLQAVHTERSVTLWARFAAFAVMVGAAGWLVAITGGEISARTGLTQTAVGAVLTAVATSLPELVTTLAAVRRGALQLAIGGIIGGNGFDTLFVAVSDVAYRPGSIYHAVTPEQLFIVGLTILLTGLLLLGLVRREKHGIANIGFESVLVILSYFAGLLLLFTA